MTQPRRHESIAGLVNAYIVAGGVYMLFSLILAGIGLPELLDDLAYEMGSSTRATITNHTSQPNFDNISKSDDYFLAYNYEGSDGRPHDATIQVPQSTYARLKNGDPIEVTYQRQDPDKSIVPSESHLYFGGYYSLFGLPGIALGGFAIYFGLKQGNHRIRILRNGISVAGTATDIVITTTKKREYNSLEYEYVDGAGNTHLGTIELLSDIRMGLWRHRLNEGTNGIEVYYDAKRPADHVAVVGDDLEE